MVMLARLQTIRLAGGSVGRVHEAMIKAEREGRPKSFETLAVAALSARVRGRGHNEGTPAGGPGYMYGATALVRCAVAHE